jgi:hypothetical protein
MRTKVITPLFLTGVILLTLTGFMRADVIPSNFLGTFLQWLADNSTGTAGSKVVLQNGPTIAEPNFTRTVYFPLDLRTGVTPRVFLWQNVTAGVFTVTRVDAVADADNTDFTLYIADADGANETTLTAVSVATNGTVYFTGTDSTFTDATIAKGQCIFYAPDSTDDPNRVTVTVTGTWSGL